MLFVPEEQAGRLHLDPRVAAPPVTLQKVWAALSFGAFGMTRLPRNLSRFPLPLTGRNRFWNGMLRLRISALRSRRAGGTPALREASAHRCVCRPRQTFRRAGVPPALLERRTLICSRNIPFQNRLRSDQERGKRLTFRGIWVTPNAPQLKAAQTFWRVTGGAATGGKMQARRLRYGRSPLTAAFAAHDRHPVAQASRLLFRDEEH